MFYRVIKTGPGLCKRKEWTQFLANFLLGTKKGKGERKPTVPGKLLPGTKKRRGGGKGREKEKHTVPSKLLLGPKRGGREGKGKRKSETERKRPQRPLLMWPSRHDQPGSNSHRGQ